jgi:hypothetical protein
MSMPFLHEKWPVLQEIGESKALQAAQAGPAPILIRIETRAGHAQENRSGKIIEDQTNQWSFLVKNLGDENSVLAMR